MSYAIKARDVGKRYCLQEARLLHGHGSLVEAVAGLVSAPARWLGRKPAQTAEDFWAVRNVNLEVRAGEAIGLIGRNGAGKSTLLKMFSRVTDPTAGEFTLRGRVASLLEVGTGFHMELSGRENIYLNGAILGMRRHEIRQRFDQIVEYAGVAKFLELPLKRFSSGMYLRLAFSVAAFLESEILIVDEVLAVGDQAFQEKCLGTMRDAAKGGRTVVFVSHNMAAIQSLTQRCVLLEQGRVAFDGPTPEAVRHYVGIKEQDDLLQRRPVKEIRCNRQLRWSDHVVIAEIGLAPGQADEIPIGGNLRMQFLLESHGSYESLRMAYSINSVAGVPVLSGLAPLITVQPGQTLLELNIDNIQLIPGDYDFSINLGTGSWSDSKRNFDNFMGFGRLRVSAMYPNGRLFGEWNAQWGPAIHSTASWVPPTALPEPLADP